MVGNNQGECDDGPDYLFGLVVNDPKTRRAILDAREKKTVVGPKGMGPNGDKTVLPKRGLEARPGSRPA